jgi:hypothetical protein
MFAVPPVFIEKHHVERDLAAHDLLDSPEFLHRGIWTAGEPRVQRLDSDFARRDGRDAVPFCPPTRPARRAWERLGFGVF